MRIKHIAIIALALLLPFAAQAQKKRVAMKKPVPAVQEEPQEDTRIIEMREAMQQIVFIDSVVVDKDRFLDAIRLYPESGTLTTYDTFFHSDGHPGTLVFLNEMGNKCYFSNENEQGRLWLYTSDKLGNEWSSPTPLKGIGDGMTEASYPFMLADGITLYFAARGSESIGGYDIFFTRYDSETGQFFKPENLGMPFNSEANDYMLAIDEMANIGYFVTDRRQPAGKACVYTFIPPTVRKTYNPDLYTDEQLRSLADIRRIADTWTNKQERQAALNRLKAVQSQASAGQKDLPAATKQMAFVINDKLTYTSASQFRAPDNEALFKEYQQMQQQLEALKSSLEKSRNFIAKAKAEDRQILKKEILESERQYEQRLFGLKALEKRIRNAENKVLQAH